MQKEEHTDMENLKERVEELRNTVTEKADELTKGVKEKAENIAGKTIDAAEKLVNDLLRKKPEDVQFEEEKIDPKDVAINELKTELDELRDKYVRLYADFDNFKKRNAKERLELFQIAGKDIVLAILPALDDFERALKASEKSGDQAAREGMQLIYNKLLKNLEARGLKAMNSIGENFDADKHEAVTEIPAPTPEQEGKIIDEVEKGYLLNEKIIRFAKVIVAAATPKN